MSLLDILIIVLIFVWFGGFILHFAGGFIHFLLAVAVILLLYRLITGKKFN
jgi:hypothetical protein